MRLNSVTKFQRDHL